jgi:hypothetical protein
MRINNTYDACSVIEGFASFEPTQEEILESWALLIKTKECWSLQGFYGRSAANLIEEGIISTEGKINWEKVAELEYE